MVEFGLDCHFSGSVRRICLVMRRFAAIGAIERFLVELGDRGGNPDKILVGCPNHAQWQPELHGTVLTLALGDRCARIMKEK
jgi:hypothetical protein